VLIALVTLGGCGAPTATPVDDGWEPATASGLAASVSTLLVGYEVGGWTGSRQQLPQGQGHSPARLLIVDVDLHLHGLAEGAEPGGAGAITPFENGAIQYSESDVASK
jgi:hypothetical protein